MTDFEQRLKSEVRSYWQGIHPDSAFVERMVHRITLDRGVTEKRFPGRYGLTVAAVVVTLLTATFSLPQPRAMAMALVRSVFKLGDVQYVFEQRGTKVDKPVSDAAPKPAAPPGPVAVDSPMRPDRHFQGSSGQFPEQATTAIKALKAPFRVPRWLPADLPVRVDISDAPKHGIQMVYYWFGDDILVAQMSRAPGDMHVVGDVSITAQEVALGKLKAVEAKTPNGVSYSFNVDGVALEVRGPNDQAEVIRRLAESLAY